MRNIAAEMAMVPSCFESSGAIGRERAQKRGSSRLIQPVSLVVYRVVTVLGELVVAGRRILD